MRRTGAYGGPDDRRRLQRNVAVRYGALVVTGEIVPELLSLRRASSECPASSPCSSVTLIGSAEPDGPPPSRDIHRPREPRSRSR